MNLKLKKMISLIVLFLLISLIFVYPLISNKLVIGHDTYFHICRIEALKNAYQHGDIFPKLYYDQNFNFGYATPLFYSDIFLILPALMRLAGVPIVITYKLFLFLCTVLTFISMYYSVRKICNNDWAGCLSGLLYVFTAYRITDVYVRGAIGEVIAMIFIPLIMLEIYNLLYTERYNYKKLGLSFSFLLLSHNITFIFMCIIFGVFIIINYKVLLEDKKRILCIVKAVVIAIGCLAFFLFPMLEQLNSGKYVVNGFVSNSNLANYTLYIKQLFTLKMNFGISGHEFGESYWMTTNTGIVTLILPLLIIIFKNKKEKFYQFCLTCMLIGYISLIACLDVIPWNYLNSVFSFIQFPWRLVIIASSFLSFCSGIAVVYGIEKISYKHVIILVSMIAVSIGSYQLSEVFNRDSKIHNNTSYSLIANDDYSGEHGIVTDFNQAELALGDYLPINTNIDYRNYGDYIKTNNKSEISNFQRAYNEMEFTIAESDSNTFYILPLIYYKGYIVQCYDSQGNFERNIVPYPDEETYLVTFNPGIQNENKTYKIFYKGTKIQFFSNIVTILCLIFLGLENCIKLSAWNTRFKR